MVTSDARASGEPLFVYASAVVPPFAWCCAPRDVFYRMFFGGWGRPFAIPFGAWLGLLVLRCFGACLCECGGGWHRARGYQWGRGPGVVYGRRLGGTRCFIGQWGFVARGTRYHDATTSYRRRGSTLFTAMFGLGKRRCQGGCHCHARYHRHHVRWEGYLTRVNGGAMTGHRGGPWGRYCTAWCGNGTMFFRDVTLATGQRKGRGDVTIVGFIVTCNACHGGQGRGNWVTCYGTCVSATCGRGGYGDWCCHGGFFLRFWGLGVFGCWALRDLSPLVVVRVVPSVLPFSAIVYKWFSTWGYF